MSKDKHWLGTKAGKPFASRKTAIQHMRTTGIAGIIKEHPNYGYGIQVKNYTEEDKARLLTYDPEEFRLKALEAKEAAAEEAAAITPMERYEAIAEDDEDDAEIARPEARMARKRIRTIEATAIPEVITEAITEAPVAQAKKKPKSKQAKKVEADVQPKPEPKKAKSAKVDSEAKRYDKALFEALHRDKETPVTTAFNRVAGGRLLNEIKSKKAYESDWAKAITANKRFDKKREGELNTAWYGARAEDLRYEQKKAKEENREVSQEVQAHAMNAKVDKARDQELSRAYAMNESFDKTRNAELSKAWYAAHRHNRTLDTAEDSMLRQAYAMNDKVDTKAIEGFIKEDVRVQKQEDNIKSAYWKQGQKEAGAIDSAEEKARYQGALLRGRTQGDDGVFSKLRSVSTGTDTSEVRDRIRESGFYDRVSDKDLDDAYTINADVDSKRGQEYDSAVKEDKAFDKKRNKELSTAWYAAHRENKRVDDKVVSEDTKDLKEALKDNTKATKAETKSKADKEKAEKTRRLARDRKVEDVFGALGKVAGMAVNVVAAGASAAIDVGHAVADNAEREQIGGAYTGYSRSSYAGLLKQLQLGNQVGNQVLGAASNVTHQVMQSPDALSGILERMATANALGGGKGLDLQGIAKDLLKGDTDSYINRMKAYTEENKGNERVVSAVTSVVGLEQLARSKNKPVDSENVDQRSTLTDDLLTNRIKLESATADALGGNLVPATEGGAEALRGFVDIAKELKDAFAEVIPAVTDSAYQAASSVVDKVAGTKVMSSKDEVFEKLNGGDRKIRFNPTGKPTWFDKAAAFKDKVEGKLSTPAQRANGAKIGEAEKAFKTLGTTPILDEYDIDSDYDYDYPPYKLGEDPLRPVDMSPYATSERDFMAAYEGKTPEERAGGYDLWRQTPQFKQNQAELYSKPTQAPSSVEEFVVRVEGDMRTNEGNVKLTQVGTTRVTSKSTNA